LTATSTSTIQIAPDTLGSGLRRVRSIASACQSSAEPCAVWRVSPAQCWSSARTQSRTTSSCWICPTRTTSSSGWLVTSHPAQALPPPLIGLHHTGGLSVSGPPLPERPHIAAGLHRQARACAGAAGGAESHGVTWILWTSNAQNPGATASTIDEMGRSGADCGERRNGLHESTQNEIPMRLHRSSRYLNLYIIWGDSSFLNDNMHVGNVLAWPHTCNMC
jgi:hypothetical protein